MKVIIVGPAQSGKTTMLHRIIRSNPTTTFSLILDGYEAFVAGAIPINFPIGISFIITTTNLNNIPQHIRAGALILEVPLLRGELAAAF